MFVLVQSAKPVADVLLPPPHFRSAVQGPASSTLPASDEYPGARHGSDSARECSCSVCASGADGARDRVACSFVVVSLPSLPSLPLLFAFPSFSAPSSLVWLHVLEVNQVSIITLSLAPCEGSLRVSTGSSRVDLFPLTRNLNNNNNLAWHPKLVVLVVYHSVTRTST